MSMLWLFHIFHRNQNCISWKWVNLLYVVNCKQSLIFSSSHVVVQMLDIIRDTWCSPNVFSIWTFERCMLLCFFWQTESPTLIWNIGKHYWFKFRHTYNTLLGSNIGLYGCVVGKIHLSHHNFWLPSWSMFFYRFLHLIPDLFFLIPDLIEL